MCDQTVQSRTAQDKGLNLEGTLLIKSLVLQQKDVNYSIHVLFLLHQLLLLGLGMAVKMWGIWAPIWRQFKTQQGPSSLHMSSLTRHGLSQFSPPDFLCIAV